MVETYLEGWRHYADFVTRSNRTDYWAFTLGNAVIDWLLLIVGQGLGHGMVVIALVWLLASMIPSIAIQFRRLHDTDRSGWWILIGLIPIAGAIVLLVFFLQPSAAGVNRYGESALPL